HHPVRGVVPHHHRNGEEEEDADLVAHVDDPSTPDGLGRGYGFAHGARLDDTQSHEALPQCPSRHRQLDGLVEEGQNRQDGEQGEDDGPVPHSAVVLGAAARLAQAEGTDRHREDESAPEDRAEGVVREAGTRPPEARSQGELAVTVAIAAVASVAVLAAVLVVARLVGLVVRRLMSPLLLLRLLPLLLRRGPRLVPGALVRGRRAIGALPLRLVASPPAVGGIAHRVSPPGEAASGCCPTY